MIKTAIVLAVIVLVAGAFILRAMRAMKAQIESDADEADDWTGAKRFGGKFEGDAGGVSETNRPPPEDEIRRTWTPIRAPVNGALSKPGGTATIPVSDAQLRKYADWCDRRCTGAWLIVLPVSGPATLWFRNRADAEAFARVWHPLAGT
ncbi:hypothetical protein EOI86_09975 [Hwanghaeella grinnelliae]|uniref:Uncharacterized protein n=1 Tax=Hwanghaeella grinnelliae TaxID=2500179 RepID=A0A3S2VSL1_9PROT|nr:hypothetical protein [Hwanghaeella grinnelliae]RVU39532.1 hypothetical protein EOI86_09975 [Hwanghaeella grinnelliae]